MSTKIKILFFYANPKNLKKIRLDEEVNRVEDEIQKAEFRDRIEIHKRGALKATDIQELLLRHQPHILHFSGHGSKTEGIFVENHKGRAEFITPAALANLLGIIKQNLFLVVFNACYSVAQANAISQIVDCTMGMRDEIFDETAIEWSVGLYRGLASGLSIEQCFRLGNNSLMLQNIPEDHIPALLTRNGVNAAEFFPLDHQAPDTPQPIPPEPPPPQEKNGTMQMHVKVLSRNTSRIIQSWRYATDDYRQLFISLYDEQDRQKPEDAWQGLLEATKGANKAAGPTARLSPDIFFLLRGNLIETLHDHRRLAEMVNQAMYYAAGSNLYLVWSQTTTFPVVYQDQSLLEDWFSGLIRSGVADIIEIPKKHRTNESDEAKILRNYALKSERRRERLRKLVNGEDWNVVHRTPASTRLAFQIFLERFLTEEQLIFTLGNNLAVFYDQPPKGGWSELLKNSRSLDRSGNWFIATVSPSNDLSEMWTQEARDSKPTYYDGVFEFEGIFEWLYALLRLKLGIRLTHETSPNVAGKALF